MAAFRRVVPARRFDRARERRDGADVYRSQARSQVFRENPGSRRDAEPHRGSEGVLRPIPAGEGAARRAARRGPAGRVQIGVPDLGFFQHLDARIRQVRVRGAEIRRRRVPPARHDLCGAAQGDAAPHRVRYRRGNRRQVGQGHQGAGCLHGRHPAHDQQRHLHRQRHRAGDRLADASLARRVLRSRQGQDPFVAASFCSPPASFPIAAPGSTSSSTPRTSSMRASTGAGRFR